MARLSGVPYAWTKQMNKDNPMRLIMILLMLTICSAYWFNGASNARNLCKWWTSWESALKRWATALMYHQSLNGFSTKPMTHARQIFSVTIRLNLKNTWKEDKEAPYIEAIAATNFADPMKHVMTPKEKIIWYGMPINILSQAQRRNGCCELMVITLMALCWNQAIVWSLSAYAVASS